MPDTPPKSPDDVVERVARAIAVALYGADTTITNQRFLRALPHAARAAIAAMDDGPPVINSANIWSEPQRRSGMPCLRGTRISVAQVLAHLSDGETVAEFCDQYTAMEGEGQLVSAALSELALWLEGRPLPEPPA